MSSRKSPKTFLQHYRRLNAEQKRAVDTIEGPVMVLAGPGTGKTEVLAMRTANILRLTHMDPWNVLCLTFTESAAAAMRARLITIIGDAAYYVRIHTFHSFCNSVIQDWPEEFMLSREWQVLADAERVEMFRALVEKLPARSILKPFGDPYFYVSDIIRALQLLKQEAVSPERFRQILRQLTAFAKASRRQLAGWLKLTAARRTEAATEQFFRQLIGQAKRLQVDPPLWQSLQRRYAHYREQLQAAAGAKESSKLRTKFKNDIKQWFDQLRRNLPKQQDLYKLYRSYQAELTRKGRYDYEDMIMHVVQKFRTNPELLAYYQEQFQYILVDEFQDTNGAQNEVVQLLGSASTSPNIGVVGDDKQSIFRFQGASLENLLSFYERYIGHVTVIPLKRNYRNHQVILDAAQAVIGHNQESVTKYIPDTAVRLAAASAPTRRLARWEVESEEEENWRVADTIQHLIKRGTDPNQIAVLYRFNRDADSLYEVMVRLHIPTRLEAGDDVLRDRRIQQLLVLLQYVAGAASDEELARVLQFDWLDLPELDVMRILQYASRRRQPLWSVVSSARSLRTAAVEYPDQFLALAKRLAWWRVVAHNETLQQFFDVVLTESGFLRHAVDAAFRFDILHKAATIFTEMQRVSAAKPQLTLSQFMDRLRLLQDSNLPLVAEPPHTGQQAVRLMTAHRAKGLEFEHVFIIRLADRHWGNVRQGSRLPLPQGILVHDPVAGQENNEDERRLFYVAVTRAKKQVYLSYAKFNSSGRAQVPSIFLEEIPPDLVTRHQAGLTEAEMRTRLKTLTFPTLPYVVSDNARGWLKDRLATYVMSVTHLNNYLECPRKFYYRNLLQVPAAKTKHMAFGTAVHGGLRDFFAAWRRRGRRPARQYLLDRFRVYLAQETLTVPDRRDAQRLGQDVLAKYYDFYKNTWGVLALVEYDFSSHGVVVGKARLTGKLDKIEITNPAAKLVNVVDYKTGNPDQAATQLRAGGAYHRQLVFYKLLCDASPRFPYQMTTGEIDFIQPSRRTGRFVKRRLTISPEDCDALTAVIDRVWQEINDLSFLDQPGCGVCQYCRTASLRRPAGSRARARTV